MELNMSEKIRRPLLGIATGGLSEVGRAAFKTPKAQELVKVEAVEAPEAVAEETQASTKNVKKKFAKRFGRRNTVLAGSTPLGANPNKNSLLGV